jgi:hypothetical protein
VSIYFLECVAAFLLLACQTTQEKNAIILKDRVDKLQSYQEWKPIRCELRTELSAPQSVKYRTVFADEKKLIDSGTVTYDWTAKHSRCEVHAKPLTPMTANQRTFVDQAFCTLLRAFWVHSPFDGLRVLPTDMIDQEKKIFLRQKEDSELGVYVDKEQFAIESQTAHKGTFSAHYEQHSGGAWVPSELRQDTTTFKFVLKDFEWDEGSTRTPPKSFWIYVGDSSMPEAHTKVHVENCTRL